MMICVMLFLFGLKFNRAFLDDNNFELDGMPYAATPVALPMPCITNESELAYTRSGSVSAQYSFFNCLGNVDSPDLIPTFYDGNINGVLHVNISLGLNNLASVSNTILCFEICCLLNVSA